MRKLKGILSAVMAVIMVISGTGFYGTDVTLAAEAESNVEYTDSSAFEFDYGSGTITGYTGSDTDVVIPERIGGVKVEAIGSAAFGNSNITSVVIPEGVTSIGSSAFEGCDLLASVTIPEGVTSIDVYAFNYCDNLKSIIIPGSVKVWEYAFYGCTGLESVEIKEGAEKVGEYAFGNCTALTSVTIPESVTRIDDSAFYGCCKLTGVTIPENTKNIGNYAFSGCKMLESITIPDSVTSIGTQAFYNCSNLNSVVIGSDNGTVGTSAFAGCIKLESVEIKEGVKSIGASAFKNCIALKEITLPKGIESIDSTAFSGTNIERVYCYRGGAADNAGLYPEGAEIVYLGDEVNTETTTSAHSGEMGTPEKGKTYSVDFGMLTAGDKLNGWSTDDGIINVVSAVDQAYVHDAQHGAALFDGDQINVAVAGNATISLALCQYGYGTEFVVTDSNGKVIDTVAGTATSDGEVVTVNYMGDATVLTFTLAATGEAYLHSVTAANDAAPIGEAKSFEIWLDDMAVDGTVATKAYTGDVALTTGETVSLGDSILELQGEGDEQYTQSYAAAVGVIRDGKTVNGYKAGAKNANANDINPIPSQGDGCAIVFTPAATGMLNTYFVSTSFLRVWDFDSATGERLGYIDSEVAAESVGLKVKSGHTYVISTTGQTNNMAYCGFEFVVDELVEIGVSFNNIDADESRMPNLEVYLTDAVLGGEPAATVKSDTASVDLAKGHTYIVSTNDNSVKASVAGSDRFTVTGDAIVIDLEDIPDVTLTGEITGAAEGVTGLTFTNMVNGTVYTATITGNTYTVDLKSGDYDTAVETTDGAFTQDRVSVVYGEENVNEVYVEVVDPSKPATYGPADLFKLEHSAGVGARENDITAKAGDTITVPVDGAAVVTVSSYYQAAFTVNGSEVFGSDSNSTSQIDTFTVNTAEGDTAAVITFTDSYNGTAIGTSYITSISVVPVVAYKNEINVPGDYATLTDAVVAIKGMIDRPEGEEGRVTINMTADIEEQVVFDAPYITLNGNGHTLSWYYGVGSFYYSVDPYTGLYSESLYRDKYSSSEANVSLWGGVAIIRGDNFIAENTTFLNTYNYYVTEKEASDVEHSVASMPERVLGADVTSYAFKERSNAFYIDADNIEAYNCKILSSQDTLGRNSSTVLGYHAYFKDCVIGGNTDYICGEFTAIFDNCELQWKTFANDDSNNGKVGMITAPKTSPYIFRNCTVTTSGLEGTGAVSGLYGRTWGADSEAYFINSETNGYISADGWGEMSSGEGVSSLFYEYNNTSNGRPFVSNGAYSKVLEDEALIASMTSDAVINDYLNGWTPVSYEPYTAPEGKLWGDVNSDGTVDVLDVSLTLDYTLQPEKVENFDATAADVNGDGIVNSTDVALILQKVLDSSFLLPGESVEIPGEITEDTTEATIEGREVIITPEYSIGGDTLTVKYNAALGANAGFNNYTMFLTFDPAVLTPVSAADGDIALADKDATGADITVSASNAETITAQFTNAPAAGDTDFEGADGVKTQAELGKVKVAYCIFDKDFSQSATGALPEFTSSGTLFTVTYNINDAAALNGTVLGANVQTLDTVSSDLGVLGTADVLVNEVAVNTSYEPGTEETTIIFEGDTAKYPVTGGYMYININTGEITGCDKTVSGVVIPERILDDVAVTSIGYGAFNGCSKLTEITIPESITSIGNYAFNNCGLTTVYCYKDSFADNTNLYPPGIEIIYLNYKAEKLFENSPKDVEIKESNTGWNIVKENGMFYAQSTNTDDGSTSSLSVTVEGPGILYYEASVSSEEYGDWLRTSVNGKKQAPVSGSNYTLDAPYVNCIVLGEGENVITWEYDKDGSGSDGQDCAWIKNLRVADIGDSNLDGKVDITDVILGQRYIADNSAITDVLGQKAADYNGDGEVDKKDTAYVLKEIIKNIV